MIRENASATIWVPRTPIRATDYLREILQGCVFIFDELQDLDGHAWGRGQPVGGFQSIKEVFGHGNLMSTLKDAFFRYPEKVTKSPVILFIME